MYQLCILRGGWKASALACLAILAVGAHYNVSCVAQTNSSGVKVDVVMEGLYNPCGIAVAGDRDNVVIYVSNSGKGEIVRIDVQRPGQAKPVVTGFPLAPFGKGPTYQLGPMGLAFLDANTLLVGGGDAADGRNVLRAFALSDSNASNNNASAESSSDSAARTATEITYKEALWTAGPIDVGSDRWGDIFQVAVEKRSSVFIACNSDEGPGLVARATLSGAAVGDFSPFVNTNPETLVSAPTAVLLTPEGDLAVGQMGSTDKQLDSVLSFYNARSGEHLFSASVGLNDMIAMAYGPSGLLYALDFGWGEGVRGGLYRLDQAQNGVKATLIEPLDHPTSLVFGADGAMYITVFGADSNKAQGTGQLLRLQEVF